jgi:hypothetical protein
MKEMECCEYGLERREHYFKVCIKSVLNHVLLVMVLKETLKMLYLAEFCKKNFFKGLPISADILKSTYDQLELGVPYYQGDQYF